MGNEKLLNCKCPLSNAMSVLGSKWKPIIVMVIEEKSMRFGTLALIINAISRKVLTDQLRELEADGILNRQEFKELPPRVEYTLTRKGLALLPILRELEKWDSEFSASKPIND